MDQEKLLSLKAAAKYLGISEGRLKEFADHGIIPAYRVAGIYIRFRKSQLEKFKDKMNIIQNQYVKYKQLRSNQDYQKDYSLASKIKDFWHFYDFYIISILIIIVTLFFIFRFSIQ
jgi:excisionase family DNA binding protein